MMYLKIAIFVLLMRSINTCTRVASESPAVTIDCQSCTPGSITLTESQITTLATTTPVNNAENCLQMTVTCAVVEIPGFLAQLTFQDGTGPTTNDLAVVPVDLVCLNDAWIYTRDTGVTVTVTEMNCAFLADPCPLCEPQTVAFPGIENVPTRGELTANGNQCQMTVTCDVSDVEGDVTTMVFQAGATSPTDTGPTVTATLICNGNEWLYSETGETVTEVSCTRTSAATCTSCVIGSIIPDGTVTLVEGVDENGCNTIQATCPANPNGLFPSYLHLIDSTTTDETSFEFPDSSQPFEQTLTCSSTGIWTFEAFGFDTVQCRYNTQP